MRDALDRPPKGSASSAKGLGPVERFKNRPTSPADASELHHAPKWRELWTHAKAARAQLASHGSGLAREQRALTHRLAALCSSARTAGNAPSGKETSSVVDVIETLHRRNIVVSARLPAVKELSAREVFDELSKYAPLYQQHMLVNDLAESARKVLHRATAQ